MNRFSKRIFPVLIFFLIAFVTSEAKILMSPYLQGVSKNSIIVMVECDNKEPVTVNYGLSNKYDKKAKTSYIVETKKMRGATYVHRVKLENLQPGTKYYYTASQEKDKTDQYYFTTAVEEGKDFRFAVMGDTRSNPNTHNRVAKKMKSANPIFSVYTGDLCMDSKYSTFKEEFFVEGQLSFSSCVPFVNSLGNHEGKDQNTKAFLDAPDSESNSKDYYSFDSGDIHFIVISNEHPTKKGTPQYEFIENDLKKTDKKWKIAVFHRPAYSAGGHNQDKYMVEISKNIFVPYKVDLCLTGHNHYYQRNYVDGIYHLVFGGGGAPLYTPGNESYTQLSVKDYHYAIFDASPNTLKMNVYNLKDEIIDSLELTK